MITTLSLTTPIFTIKTLRSSVGSGLSTKQKQTGTKNVSCSLTKIPEFFVSNFYNVMYVCVFYTYMVYIYVKNVCIGIDIDR